MGPLQRLSYRPHRLKSAASALILDRSRLIFADREGALFKPKLLPTWL
jgi:hypothetical protein